MSQGEDLDGKDLDSLLAIGLRLADRSDDFFAEIRRELSGTSPASSPAAPAPPKAALKLPRRQRKPTLASVAKQASKAALEVARYEVRPDGTVVIVTGKSEPTQTSNPWLDDLKVTKQ